MGIDHSHLARTETRPDDVSAEESVPIPATILYRLYVPEQYFPARVEALALTGHFDGEHPGPWRTITPGAQAARALNSAREGAATTGSTAGWWLMAGLREAQRSPLTLLPRPSPPGRPVSSAPPKAL